jgi:threonine/homoserine/homoserine lactone efflux protein
VIDAAYRHTMRRAIAVALGAACADGLYSALGVVLLAPLLNAHPTLRPIFYAVSGVVLLVYGFLTARSEAAPPTTPEGPHAPEAPNEMMVGVITGLALIVLNPAAIVTWVVIMGSTLPEWFPDMTTADGIFCALGVLVGSFGWFALVAHLTQKGKHVLGDKAAWIPRVIGVALMVYAAYLLYKAVRFLIV